MTKNNSAKPISRRTTQFATLPSRRVKFELVYWKFTNKKDIFTIM
jgi:hypothetical protein